MEDIFAKANILLDKEQYLEAVELYSKCILLEDYKNIRLNIFIQRGYSFYQLKNYSNALKDFTSALQFKENVPTVYYYRARCKEHLEDYSGALDDFTKSAELDPKQSDVFISIGIMNEELGNTENAIKAYKKALEIDPSDSFVKNVLNELEL